MDDDEAYILLLLSDGNLPTGSFVASSGLESYVKHGFTSIPGSTTITFVRDNLAAYAYSALPFVSDAHLAVSSFGSVGGHSEDGDDFKVEDFQWIVDHLTAIDDLYDAMTLNHVARRASKSQGVALLTLYSKGFSRPSSFSAITDQEAWGRELRMNKLLERFKLLVRKEELYGHLPTCWGALTAALGLTLGSQP